MNPLIKAFGLAILNVLAYLFLRLDTTIGSHFAEKVQNVISFSESHFVIVWGISLLLIVLAIITAGKLSPPKRLSLRNIFSPRQ